MKTENKTLEDIARLASVSKSTVSKVVHGYPTISEATRSRILKLMQDHSFQPNFIARMQVKQSAYTIGLIVPQIDFVKGYFYESLLRGLISTFSDAGFSAMFIPCANGKGWENIISLYRSMRLTGCIFISENEGMDRMIQSFSSQVPLVFVNRYFDNSDILCIGTDNLESSHTATHYLFELGHKKIVLLTGDTKFHAIHERIKGFRMACLEKNIDPNPWIHGISFSISYEKLKKKINFILHSKYRPSAFFCGNDELAFKTIHILNEYNFHVPKDFSVMGFDAIQFGEYFNPPLTSVLQKSFQMGKLGAKLLLQKIEGKKPKQANILLKNELVIRKSCMNIN